MIIKMPRERAKALLRGGAFYPCPKGQGNAGRGNAGQGNADRATQKEHHKFWEIYSQASEID